ncbi:protein of unknown function [Xenorhabdus doucetiae]|uniref:Uncharacterized protein n=1 Tax=Xenorhabdus doucetiae TaxID=351671 RepID=A0A068QR07_9GAMM|nr:protein of unknown function [Xenorhabdus doucetiae]
MEAMSTEEKLKTESELISAQKLLIKTTYWGLGRGTIVGKERKNALLTLVERKFFITIII